MDLLSELEKGEHVDLNAQARMREKLFLGPNSNGAPNSRQEKKGTLKVKRPNAFNQPGIGPPGQISANSSDILKLNSDLQPIDCLLPPSINARMRKQGQSTSVADARHQNVQGVGEHQQDFLIDRDTSVSGARDRIGQFPSEHSPQATLAVSKRIEDADTKRSDEAAESDKSGGPNVQQSAGSAAQSDKDPLQLLARLIKKPNSTEFWYLRKYEADCMTPLNPYHIEIVPHSAIAGNDYFTMSSHGVTHFVDGIPDFTPLLRWRREYEVFVRLRRIPVLGKYRFWKPFKVWKLVVHYGKMRKHQDLLTKKLFLLDPTFQRLLLQIRGLCEDLRGHPLHSFDPDRLDDLPAFVDEQAAERAAFAQRLEAFWRTGIAHAAQACVDTLDALDEKLFKSKSRSAALAAAGAAGPAKGAAAGSVGAAGAVGKDDVSNFRYTVMASKRIEHQRLFALLRACDYLVANTLHEIVVTTMEALLAHATHATPPPRPRSSGSAAAETPPPEPGVNGGADGAEGGDGAADGEQEEAAASGEEGEGAGVRAHFVTEVLLEEGELLFAPSAVDFENALERTLDGFVDAVGGDMRLVTYPELRAHTALYESDADLSEAATVADVVNNDERYQRLREAFLSSVSHVCVCVRARVLAYMCERARVRLVCLSMFARGHAVCRVCRVPCRLCIWLCTVCASCVARTHTAGARSPHLPPPLQQPPTPSPCVISRHSTPCPIPHTSSHIPHPCHATPLLRPSHHPALLAHPSSPAALA